jgi:mercuric ion transport protein
MAGSGHDRGAVLGGMLGMGGVLAAFGAASCCGLPFLLASAGLNAAWLGGVGLLAAPHRAALLVAGSAGLAGGAVALIWRPRGACARRARWLIWLGLIAGVELLILGARYG